MNTAVFIQDQTEFEILRAKTSLLVIDCTATWCGPCKVIAPFIDQLAANYSDRAQVMKLDIDANKPLAKEFGLKSIPAVLFFKDGELVETMIGVKTYEEFSKTLDKYL
ncbi:thioredoxin domain-containing protein [Pseudanabaena galeata UHCC 0370]|jgi:thioredoxin 1|uniref:Thioredoxin n=1 Tax=Pseudanabaena galeata UHCC 0370 TaxID=3110310 RepID=A0ABU5TDI7_9CYAN|nr:MULTISPECIES: thioredoxin domain-containing protein [Pseudanabaena]MEA5476339.1 thioredoxin domain-containing protein [Pseudanabaena galeata UHCC 0370]MEA5485478.1 thioredoxin domain-containing protein [Pseudanabaena sp. CCNP1317]WGS73695.1 thioredoxin domain-containing protein [Pseudanabaena galeata CCNP1313]